VLTGFLAEVLTAGCVAQIAPSKEEAAVSIEITMEVADEVDVAKVTAGSPLYDLGQARMNLVFSNNGTTAQSFPGEAIMYRVLRVYTDKRRGTQQVFAENEPPLNTLKVTRLAPGESWRFGLNFELPDQLLRLDEKVLPVQVCVA
jgi:hypothetical protein